MQRHEFLAALHRRLEPRNYLEIGVSDGRSLALSTVPSIGVDPTFRITARIDCDAHFVKATSDAFFGRKDPLTHLRGGRIPWRDLRSNPGHAGRWIRPVSRGGEAPELDFAFIDGMHLFEFALRDFMNVERFTIPTSVIVFDDMLPRSVVEAARDRTTKFWAGDVFKLQRVLQVNRPDLSVIPVDTAPTGLLIVLVPDREDTVLRDRYDTIVKENVRPDPQIVPDTILRRVDAVDPRAFLTGGTLDVIVQGRRDHSSRERLTAALRHESELNHAITAPDREVLRGGPA